MPGACYIVIYNLANDLPVLVLNPPQNHLSSASSDSSITRITMASTMLTRSSANLQVGRRAPRPRSASSWLRMLNVAAPGALAGRQGLVQGRQGQPRAHRGVPRRGAEGRGQGERTRVDRAAQLQTSARGCSSGRADRPGSQQLLLLLPQVDRSKDQLYFSSESTLQYLDGSLPG